ncbi:MAG: hypothetical protein IJX14_02495 [Clostridia bacterium]|nr:hypothetical protein [Clostridia bacterium]
MDYKGVNFTFISPAHYDLAWYMVVPEETNGEFLNDAIIEQNNKMGGMILEAMAAQSVSTVSP